MRIIMMGTGGYAVPTFEALLDAEEIDVACLFTKPPPSGKKKKSIPINPMRQAAEARGVTIHDPESINSEEAHQLLAPYAADLFVVCDYGHILSPEALALARHGGINLHASLLPKYRGAAPINWAIYNGDEVTGNTVLHMTPKIDAGPSVAQEQVAIGDAETAIELEERLSQLGAPLVLEAIAAIAENRLQPIEQEKSEVTRAPRLKKRDGNIDWSRTSRQIFDLTRAMKPWPGTFSHWHRAEKEPLRLTIPQVRVLDGDEAVELLGGQAADSSVPGAVLLAAEQLVLATGDGAVSLEEVQPAGKRVLSAAEFLRGYPVQAGDRFGAV